MGLWDQARRDVQRITTDLSDFAVPVLFIDPSGAFALVKAIAVKHHLGVNMDNGQPVNAKTARVTVAEAVLTATGYPVRNSAKEVSLSGHRVEWTDSAGNSCKYIISEWMPDETVGLILCQLKDYE